MSRAVIHKHDLKNESKHVNVTTQPQSIVKRNSQANLTKRKCKGTILSQSDMIDLPNGSTNTKLRNGILSARVDSPKAKFAEQKLQETDSKHFIQHIGIHNPTRRKTNSMYEEIMKQSVIGLKIAKFKKSQNKSSARIVMNKDEPKEVLNQIQNEVNMRRKNNKSSVLGLMSSGSKLKKSNSKKITVKFSSPIEKSNNSPKLQSKNIHHLLECLDDKKNDDNRGVYISHDIAKMLRMLLKSELKKINAKEKKSPSCGMKGRKASVAELEPIPDEPEQEIIVPKEPWSHGEKNKGVKHSKREPYKPAINVSIHHNVGNVCYAPVFIGHNRNTSKDISESNIKTGISAISTKPHCMLFDY